MAGHIAAKKTKRNHRGVQEQADGKQRSQDGADVVERLSQAIGGPADLGGVMSASRASRGATRIPLPTRSRKRARITVPRLCAPGRAVGGRRHSPEQEQLAPTRKSLSAPERSSRWRRWPQRCLRQCRPTARSRPGARSETAAARCESARTETSMSRLISPSATTPQAFPDATWQALDEVTTVSRMPERRRARVVVAGGLLGRCPSGE